MYSDCCQHPTGMGKSFAIHGQLSPQAAFFFVENNETDDVLAQSWVWGTGDGKHVVFDNIEGKGIKQGDKRIPIILKIYEGASKEIKRILGEGGSVRVGQQYGIGKESFEPYNKSDDILPLPADFYNMEDIESRSYLGDSRKEQRVLANKRKNMIRISYVTKLNLEEINSSEQNFHSYEPLVRQLGKIGSEEIGNLVASGDELVDDFEDNFEGMRQNRAGYASNDFYVYIVTPDPPFQIPGGPFIKSEADITADIIKQYPEFMIRGYTYGYVTPVKNVYTDVSQIITKGIEKATGVQGVRYNGNVIEIDEIAISKRENELLSQQIKDKYKNLEGTPEYLNHVKHDLNIAQKKFSAQSFNTLVQKLVEAMGQRRLPVVAACRASTSYLLLKRHPLLNKLVKEKGYIMGDPIKHEDYWGINEDYYDIVLIPVDWAQNLASQNFGAFGTNDVAYAAKKLDDHGFYKKAEKLDKLFSYLKNFI
jgi:hypothetical protein